MHLMIISYILTNFQHIFVSTCICGVTKTSHWEKHHECYKCFLPSHKLLCLLEFWRRLSEEGGWACCCCLFCRHCLKLTQAVVGWFGSVVIWLVTDKSKHSGSHVIVLGKEISWELPAGPPTHNIHIYNLYQKQTGLLTIS